MEEDGGTVVNSTKLQIEEFKKSFVWQDIIRELDEWQKGFEIEMFSIVDDAKENNPTTASTLMHMGDINGRVKTVEYVKYLPNMLLDILKQRAEDKK